MLTRIAEIQPLFLGLVLAWTGGYKLGGRKGVAQAPRSALATLVGRRRVGAAYLGVGGAELGVATALLLPPALVWEAWLAVLLGVGFLSYLWYARSAAPQSSCGCMSADAGPVTWRGIARAGLVLAAALGASFADGPWTRPFGSDPVTAYAALGIEAALLLALSPDLDRHRRRLAGRLRALVGPHPLAATAHARAPLATAVSKLHRSEIYLAHAWRLDSSIQDYWEAEGWMLLSYAGRVDRAKTSPPVTVVFAVPAQDPPDEVRMSMVDSAGEPVPIPPREPTPPLAVASIRF